jgi:hypothetical protein
MVRGPWSRDAVRYDRPSHAPRETISEVDLAEVHDGERRLRTELGDD